MVSSPLGKYRPPQTAKVASVNSATTMGEMRSAPRPEVQGVLSTPLCQQDSTPRLAAAQPASDVCMPPSRFATPESCAPPCSDPLAPSRRAAIADPGFPIGTLYAHAPAELPPPPLVAGVHSSKPGELHQSLSVSAELAQRLLDDASAYALKPGSLEAMTRLCAGVLDDTWDNPNSKNKLDSNMRLWRMYTDELNTPCWRPHHSTLGVDGVERESVLAGGFIPFALRHMRGRKGNARAKPQSAYKCYLGVRKAHSKRLIEMTPVKNVWQIVQRHCREHLEEYGGMSLAVTRKQPFTRAILHAILTAEDSTRNIDLRDGNTRVAFRAFTAVLRQTGMRKSELSLQRGEKFTKRHASRANLKWCLRGTIYSNPPPDLLRNPRPGDYAILVPPLSKADSTGEVWGALPIYLHYDASDVDAAFHHLAALELAMPAANAASRALIPLISPNGTVPFQACHLDSILSIILRRLIGATAARMYSWHSARIYLACSLLAAGATAAQIQSLCRWQTEDSLRVYARLNADKYRQLLSAAAGADVASVSTASLPPLSDELALRQLLGLSLRDVEREGEP